jgi:hypothetical protein
MAKQTFTTGQVLTAAMMTSLQQTAMLGGAASAKTASYTLVAADAGGAISMSNASATTITVNNALFAAGDTVQITNLGAGVCTITAGTATVNTSASLALAQYESGTLDFTSTSAAIFIKGAGAAAASGSMTQLATGTLSGATTTLSSISGSYKDLRIVVENFKPTTDGASLGLRINSDATASRHSTNDSYGQSQGVSFTATTISLTSDNDNSVATGLIITNIYDYANTATWKMLDNRAIGVNPTTTTQYDARNNTGYYNQIAAITSLQFIVGGGATSGTYYLYGVN